VSALAPFDRFVAGEHATLSVDAQRGFQHFLRLQCDVCHSTPRLRELTSTAPYGHNGALATLEAWLDHYVRVTSSSTSDSVGRLDPVLFPVTLTPQEKQELVVFLHSLSSDYASEWTQKPQSNLRPLGQQ
jgi:cytochrome c peroxidase